MGAPRTILLPMAALSGVGFALIGIAYRMGQPHGISPLHIMLYMAAGGTLLFGARSRGLSLRKAPPVVLAYGIGAGFSQYMLLKVIDAGMRMGPISPVWCALSLGVVPTLLVAMAMFGERLSTLKALALCSGLGCLLLASKSQQPAGSPAGSAAFVPSPAYLGVLLLIPALNSVTQIAIKHMGYASWGEGNLMDGFRPLFLLLLYATLGVSTAADLLARGDLGVPLGLTASLGCMATVGTLSGMSLLTACARLPAALLFPISNVVSTLVVALVATSVLGDPRSVWWYGTVILAVLTVILAGLGSREGAKGQP